MAHASSKSGGGQNCGNASHVKRYAPVRKAANIAEKSLSYTLEEINLRRG
jgi:hypothetical protein